jgi:hypothetical protein
MFGDRPLMQGYVWSRVAWHHVVVTIQLNVQEMALVAYVIRIIGDIRITE